MAYNGSGTFSLVAGNPVVTGTTISSTWANNTLTDIATGLTTAITKDGQTTPTANIPLGGFRITGLGTGTAVTDAIRVDAVQNSAPITLSSVAGTNTITGSATPTPAAYVAGQVFRFIPANTVTGATTLNVSSLGAGAVQQNGAALVGGEIVSGVPVEVFVTTSTPVFSILSPLAPRFKLGTFTRDTSAATGNVSYTGVGFKPKTVLFFGSVNTTDVATFGMDDATVFQAVFHTATTPRWEVVATASIVASDTVNAQSGKVTSMDDDGFTIAWTKTGTPTGTLTVYYLAFK